MRCAILGFVAGAALLQTQADLPGRLALLALASLAALLLCALNGAARAAVAGALLGFCWAALLAHSALAPQLAKADEGRDVTVVGTIDSLPHHFEQGVRFHFAVERVLAPRLVLPPRLSLAWYAGRDGAAGVVGQVRPGERWQLTVRLQRPHGNANPYGFDYEVWLLEQGVRATGYVRAAGGANRRLDSFVFTFGHLVERCRSTLRERILHALPDAAYAGVIVALVVGDQRAIDQSDWAVFNRTGIGHLISISGLHITMIAGLAALAASALWRRSFFTTLELPLILPAQKVAAASGASVALLYVLLAGFGVPAQRTLYMLSVVALALWFGRITSVSHVLCCALGLVVVIDPWAVLGPGFWLSFGAVAIILYATVGRTVPHAQDGEAGGARGRLRAALKVGAHTQYVVTLGLVPLTMLLFSQVSLVSPVANALAIPVISLVVTPLSLLGSLLPSPLGTAPLALAHAIVALLAQTLQWLGASRLAVWSAPSPPTWIFCWALVGTLWMLAPRGWPHRWLGMVSWIPLLTALPAHPEPGRMWVTAFDVGQGMALLIETSGHRLLYDAGPLYAPDSNGGNRVILPYLTARGIGMLDAMVVSHSDSDHSGGARAVLEGVRVGWLTSSLDPTHALVRAAPRHRRCEAGQGWQWDGVRFEMLHPPAGSYGDASLKPNARSCTLKISVGGHAMLLAGDIEAAQEAQLLSRSGAALAADVLLVPHHGSGTSSTPAFLLAVRPAWAVFQLGHRNRYHHPKAEVAQRYRQMGIVALRTDQAGALTLRFGERIEVSAYRTAHRRYWQDR
ncbi:MAG: DNA internalization-related competence protein ComEC/Rec2 [Pseudomonadota bacterium]